MYYKNRRCPHCGRTTGLYTIVRRKKTYHRRYDFAGNCVGDELQDASEVGDVMFYCKACENLVCTGEEQYQQMFGADDRKEVRYEAET